MSADAQADSAAAEAADRVEPAVTSPRRFDKRLLVVSLVIAIGLVLVVRGLAVGITGADRVKLPEQVEEVEPVPEAVQVLSQTRVFVDLIDGHTGVLVIDGVELPTVDVGEVASEQGVEPGQQVQVPAATIFEPGNATLTFIPSDDAPITEFESGLHDATVIFWKVDEGRQFAHSFSWTFNVV